MLFFIKFFFIFTCLIFSSNIGNTIFQISKIDNKSTEILFNIPQIEIEKDSDGYTVFQDDDLNSFSNQNEEIKQAFFEMTHVTVVRVEESAVNKDELKKIFLSDVPTEMYPEIEKRFFEIVKSIGYPEIKLGKRIDFKELFEKNQK